MKVKAVYVFFAYITPITTTQTASSEGWSFMIKACLRKNFDRKVILGERKRLLSNPSCARFFAAHKFVLSSSMFKHGITDILEWYIKIGLKPKKHWVNGRYGQALRDYSACNVKRSICRAQSDGFSTVIISFWK